PFDVTYPANPRTISFFDRSGPHSQGAHYVGFMDGEYMHISSGAPDFVPTNPKDHQFYSIVDVRNPSKPEEVGRWWLPGTRQGDDVPPPVRPKKPDAGFASHNIHVYPERPDRATAASHQDGHRLPVVGPITSISTIRRHPRSVPTTSSSVPSSAWAYGSMMSRRTPSIPTRWATMCHRPRPGHGWMPFR